MVVSTVTLIFQDMIRSPALHEDPQLKVTSLLAFSHLLRIACVDCKSRYAQYTDETFDATCELRHASPYISWFASMLRSDASLRRVYVSALGNTGAVAALGPLKAVAEDVSVSPYQRASAVLAMKYQALSFPEQTSQILFSLYHDVGQPVAVRVSAVSLLFYTKPQLVLLQRIAVLTWYDPSLAVAAFVRSSLMSLANLQDPLFTEL
jgi:HEAT repeat protein